MKATSKLFAAIVFMTVATCAIAQQPPVAYPAGNQSTEKQATDKSACMTWAQSNAAVQPVPPPQTGPAVGGGQRVAGAVRGAAAGAVIGGVANGDSGRGAGVGATAGVVAGGMRARQDRRAQNAASADVQTQNTAALNQAYGACMKGRGYTVN